MLLVLMGLALGIWLHGSLNAPLAFWLVAGAAFFLVWVSLWLWRSRLSLVALFGLLVIVGAVRQSAHLASVRDGDLGELAPNSPEPIALEAIALTGARLAAPSEATPLEFMPQRSTTHVLIQVNRVRDGESWREASGKSWLLVQGNLKELGAGDQLRIFGEYSRLRTRGNPGEPDRSRQRDIDGVQFYLRCESPSQVTILERGSPYSIARWIGFQRQAWISRLYRQLGEKQGGLAAAILLGAKEQLDSARLDSFLLVGMSHILVVSGANVAILAGALLWVQRVFGLPRLVTLGGTAVFVVWFALLADADAPVVRAAAAMLVILLAQYASRRIDSVQAWSAAGAAVLMLNPGYLFSLGALLSFLSVATLIQAALSHEPPRRKTDPLDRLIFASRPFVERWLIRLAEMLWEALRTSVWVWLATTPLLWCEFGFLQWGPILLNPLLAIPFLVTLWSGMLFLITDGLVPGFSSIMGEACQCSLEVMEWTVALFRGAAAPTMLAPPPPRWWAILFYAGALLAVVALPGRQRRSLLEPRNNAPNPFLNRRRWILAGAAMLWLIFGSVLGRSQVVETADRLKLTFLNVGHGTCVLMEFPGGETWVYDAGNKSDGRGAARILWEALLASRKTRIHRLFVSHDDTDHYSAIPTLLKRVSVGGVLWTRDMADPHSRAGKYLVESVAVSGTPSEVVSEGASWQVGDVTLRVMHPSTSETFGSDNSRSIVLEIEFAGRRVLLPGDLETPGLEFVMSRDTKPYDVVMAPHHGSERSVPGRFAGWARPKFVVISGDEEDRRDSTFAAYASGGAEVFHTADHGGVVVEISAKGELVVRPFVAKNPSP